MSKDDFQVTSEIYFPNEADSMKSPKPRLSEDNVVTNFYYRSNILSVDEDGDFLVKRKDDGKEESFIAIEHSPQSSLKLVGRQVWRGALLLADFLMYGGKQLLGNKVVLEVGAGVGLTSIVAAMYSKQVICTDVDIGGILELIRANVERNAHYILADFQVLPLDFFADSWSNELVEKISKVSIVLAADVIYDNDLTEGFVKTLIKILSIPPEKTVYFALEKRFVFTVSDLDSVAPCYEYFKTCLERARQENPHVKFHSQELETKFPQFYQYERVKQLVLWKISTDYT